MNELSNDLEEQADMLKQKLNKFEKDYKKSNDSKSSERKDGRKDSVLEEIDNMEIMADKLMELSDEHMRAIGEVRQLYNNKIGCVEDKDEINRLNEELEREIGLLKLEYEESKRNLKIDI